MASGNLAIHHLTQETDLAPMDFGSDIHLHLLVYEGRVTVACDGSEYVIGPKMMLDGVNRDHCRLLSVTPGTKATALTVRRSFVTLLLKGSPMVPFEYVQSCVENPCRMLSDQSFGRIAHGIDEIEDILMHPESRFQRQMLEHAMTMIMMVISDCYQSDLGTDVQSVQQASRARQQFMRFLQLLPRHVNAEHSVAFYASELCITPQYLNRIIKQASGDNVMTWIRKYLTGNIAHALTETDDTMLQLAIRFNFSDVTTFTRYFKTSTGQTPLEYRNQTRSLLRDAATKR